VLDLPIGPEFEDRTRSDLEGLFLRLCSRHRLPSPEVNVRIGPHLVDFLWRDAMVVVETDGYRFHRGRAAFEDDRRRDLMLRRSGFTVLRHGESPLVEEPDRVAEALRAADATARRRVGGDGDQ
jgi:very-short-patch-repair endonuclease